MRSIFSMLWVMALAGCGAETVGTAAVEAKLQAEQVKQGQQRVEEVKAKLDASMQQALEHQQKALEQAGK